MSKKILFTIDNVELLKENPDSRFSILSLDFFASGNNLHDTYVSEETLRRTASSIKNCPLVWEYDRLYDDVGSHDIEETPCGFIPESAKIIEKVLPDGRIMLSVKAYVWKYYSGQILGFFKRDGDKPISVEVEVFDFKEMDNGIIELCDYKFQAITVLGSKVEPAIPLAHAKVLQFAKEYRRDYNLEFSKKYESIDFSVPKEVKSNAQKGIDLYKEFERGGNPASFALARHLIKKEITNATKIRHMCKIFSGKKFEDIDEDLPSDSYIAFMLYGGSEGYEWSNNVGNLLDEEDEKSLTYFEGEDIMPYENLSEINDALKGIDPPITIGQANSISAQADAIGVDEEKNGWAIAIADFEKTNMAIDGHWVKKEEEDFSADNSNDNISVDKDKKIEKEDENSVKNQKNDKEKFSLNSSQIIEILNNSLSSYTYGENKYAKYWVEAFDDEYAYVCDFEDGKKYQAKYGIDSDIGKILLDGKEEVISAGWKVVGGEDFSVSINENIDVDDLVALFEDEEETCGVLKAEFDKKDEDKDFSVIINTIYLKVKNLFETNKEFATSNEKLQDFKNQIEKERFEFEVGVALKELQETVEIPEKVIAEMKEKSSEYDLTTIDSWKTDCKAQAFGYAIKQEDEDSKEKKYGLPWGKPGDAKKSFWDELKQK